MKITPRKIISLLVCGSLITPTIVLLAAFSWPYFWIPFIVATALLYLVCRSFPNQEITAGVVASLPGLIIPMVLWRIVLFTWEPVEEARAGGGLYTILTMGDPNSIETIVRFLLFPAGLVIASGLLAGRLARLATSKQKMSNHTDSPNGDSL